MAGVLLHNRASRTRLQLADHVHIVEGLNPRDQSSLLHVELRGGMVRLGSEVERSPRNVPCLGEGRLCICICHGQVYM